MKNSAGVSRLHADYANAQKALFCIRRIINIVGSLRLPDHAQHWYAERDWSVDIAVEQKWRSAIDALAVDAFAQLPE